MPESFHPQVQPIEWRDGVLRILDQTCLPAEVRYIETRDYRDVAEAIRRLAVRGAPLIGIAAAYGLALAERAGDDVRAAAGALAATRPTAVNLRWALDRALASGDGSVCEAMRIHDEQIAADLRSGEFGAALIAPGSTILTHCNAGSLATGGIGSALGVVKTAHWQGKGIRVLVDETRPLLQGARLTAWELAREGVPYEIIVDSAAAGLIARGAVQAVIVGADRIAANGDVANKVGTYGLALASAAHGVPFYVVAPVSTIDASARSGAEIVIEERDAGEVLAYGGTRTGPADAGARNPAFDVTPAALVTAIVSERGAVAARDVGSWTLEAGGGVSGGALDAGRWTLEAGRADETSASIRAGGDACATPGDGERSAGGITAGDGRATLLGGGDAAGGGAALDVGRWTLAAGNEGSGAGRAGGDACATPGDGCVTLGDARESGDARRAVVR